MGEKEWRKRVSGHRQRLREKFLENGISAFNDVEILEMLFGFGTPRQDCKERARAALKRFGSLTRVLEAQADQLCRIPGVGPNNAFAVLFVHQVARTFLKRRLEERVVVKGALDLVEYLWHRLGSMRREVFLAVYLDSANGVIKLDELFAGTINATAVYPREVMAKALECNAASMIFAHNHPSGRVRPSRADFDITARLVAAARLLDMRVLDHIIIGGPGSYYSFAEEGVMEEAAGSLPLHGG